MDKNKRLTPLKSKLKVAFCHKEKKNLKCTDIQTYERQNQGYILKANIWK